MLPNRYYKYTGLKRKSGTYKAGKRPSRAKDTKPGDCARPRGPRGATRSSSPALKPRKLGSAARQPRLSKSASGASPPKPRLFKSASSRDSEADHRQSACAKRLQAAALEPVPQRRMKYTIGRFGSRNIPARSAARIDHRPATSPIAVEKNLEAEICEMIETGALSIDAGSAAEKVDKRSQGFRQLGRDKADKPHNCALDAVPRESWGMCHSEWVRLEAFRNRCHRQHLLAPRTPPVLKPFFDSDEEFPPHLMKRAERPPKAPKEAKEPQTRSFLNRC